MKLLRNGHCAGLRSVVVVGHRVSEDNGVAVDFAATCKLAVGRVSVVGDSDICAINISINVGQKAAEVRDADFRFAHAGDANRCSQSATAAICASVRADKFGAPLSIAKAAGADFKTVVADAVAIEASTVGATINVFTSIRIAASGGEH